MKEVYKIGAIIIKNKKLLVVKEKDLGLFISVGGKPEKDETPRETLEREIKEEIGAQLVDMKPWGGFSSECASPEKYDRITMDTYFVEIDGGVNPSNEIEDFCWVGKDYKQKNIKLAPLLEKVILPKLIELNLIE